MGRKTFESIPLNKRPLKGRINFILTRNKELIDSTPLDENLEYYPQYYISMKIFREFYDNIYPDVFVIGGGEIYNIFMRLADSIYLTHVEGMDGKDVKFENGFEPNVFCDAIPNSFQLRQYSPKYNFFYHYEYPFKKQELSYRFLQYDKTNNPTDEYKYLVLMNSILVHGNRRIDRTETGTISLFGNQMRFSIFDGIIPLLTTKKVQFKSIVEELLWFCRGDTDSKILHQKNIHIWDGNTSREFLDKRGLFDTPEGVLGAGYGWQIRHQGAKYDPKYADSRNIPDSVGGFDQLAYVEDLLRNDPFSRRIMMSYWNPSDFDKTALLPCHYSVQFYVEEMEKNRYLSCHFTMRSNDMMCGWPWNIVSYSVLTHILALRHGFIPHEIVYTCADSHIYTSHEEAVKLQLKRTPRPFPFVVLNNELKTKDWMEMTADDFELVGYFPDRAILVKMAV